MSNEISQRPDDPRVIAFLQQFPNAKLDGFDPESERRLRAKAGVISEPKKEPVKSGTTGTISSDRLAVLVAIGDNVHEIALDDEQRAALLAFIVKLHNGTPHLHAQAIENLSVEIFASKA